MQAKTIEQSAGDGGRIYRFRNLLERYRPLKTRVASLERREAFRFNVFELFGLERQERVHSCFLRELLDPMGSHSQGDLFLRAFLEYCQSKYSRFPRLLDSAQFDLGNLRVYAEIPTGLGRPDLLILLEARFAVVIENKIDAPEGRDQINRYRKWLENQPEAKNGEIALLYLTPCPSGVVSRSWWKSRKASRSGELSHN